MVTLRVLSSYEAGPVRYRAGETVTVTDEFAEFLLRDSPGSFERVNEADESAGADAAQDGVTRVPPRGRRR